MQHGVYHNGDRCLEYGSFKNETYYASELFLNDNEEQGWKSQAPAIFRLVKKLIEKNLTIKDLYDDSYEFQAMPEGYAIQIYSSIKRAEIGNKNHTRYLSAIACFADFSRIIIDYAAYNKHSFLGDMILADRYLQECKAWRYSGRWSTETLLKSIGRLSHLLAHLLPVRLGNAGIMGWIQRGIALSQGVELGEYSQRTGKFTDPDPNKDTTLSWDFMALVTPDREEYATWFSQYAFIDYTYR